jgi:hypothetical protein
MLKPHSQPFEVIFLHELYWIKKRREALQTSIELPTPDAAKMPKEEAALDQKGRPPEVLAPAAVEVPDGKPAKEPLALIIDKHFWCESETLFPETLYSEIAERAFEQRLNQIPSKQPDTKVSEEELKELSKIVEGWLSKRSSAGLTEENAPRVQAHLAAGLRQEFQSQREKLSDKLKKLSLKRELLLKKLAKDQKLAEKYNKLPEKCKKRVDVCQKLVDECENHEKGCQKLANEIVACLLTDPKVRLSSIEADVLQADLCGLAISGGGIRSATFSLGVLQGLAMTGFLSRVDYISTVSGGGYIGAWFSAWGKREGFKNVEQQLLPPVRQNQPASKSKTVVEAEPIRHLRLYSNYLAPRPGLFTFDGWVLIAICLRNLLLNQLLLLLTLLSFFTGVRAVIELFSLMHGCQNPSNYLLGGLLVVSLGLVLWSQFGMWGIAPGPWMPPEGKNQHEGQDPAQVKKPPALESDDYWYYCIIPWLFSALVISILFSSPAAENWFKPSTVIAAKTANSWLTCPQRCLNASNFVWYMLLAGAVAGLLHALMGGLAFSRSRRAAGSGLFAGFIGGIAIFFSLSVLAKVSHLTIESPNEAMTFGWSELARILRLTIVSPNEAVIFGWSGLARVLHLTIVSPNEQVDLTVALFATFGMPLCVGLFVLTNFLMIGFCGPRLSELEREWWSSWNSRFMYFGTAWAILFGTVIFGPWLLVSGWHLVADNSWLKVAAGTAGTGWFGILYSGLKAASGSQTGSNRQSGIPELLARVAPFLFLITLLLGVSLFATWGTYCISDLINLWHNELTNASGNMWTRPQTILTILNSANLDPKGLKSAEWIMQIPAGFLWLSGGCIVLGILSHFLGKCIGVNTFSMQNLYANRLVRCYLGASQKCRTPDSIVNMDPNDDMKMSELFPGPGFRQHTDWLRPIEDRQSDGPLEPAKWGPISIINGALNQKASAVRKRGDFATNDAATDAERQAESLQFLERQAESFVFTPLYCGSETTGYYPSCHYAGGVKLGTAIAVSGAAVSPNMGYHSSPAITALLTVFNIRLGAWFGNPCSNTRNEPDPPASATLLFQELAGVTDAESERVYISDGGHFENMGVYELIRRRCRFIVAVDAGADPKIHENVGRLVRQVRIDFGILIEIDMSTVTPAENGLCQSHVVVGRIHYGDVHKTTQLERSLNDPTFSYDSNDGIIIWIKNSLTGDEPGDLANHAAMHRDFPYDSTLDQFFSEPQFESYRALGLHSILKSFVRPGGRNSGSAATQANGKSASSDWARDLPTQTVFETIYEHWLAAPAKYVTDYVHYNETYAKILTTLRTNSDLAEMAIELYGTEPQKQQLAKRGRTAPKIAERLMANEMFSMLESVYLSLDLERQYLHPVHLGWMKVFDHWVKAPALLNSWKDSPVLLPDGTSTDVPKPYRDGLNHEYGSAFGSFIEFVISRETEK